MSRIASFNANVIIMVPFMTVPTPRLLSDFTLWMVFSLVAFTKRHMLLLILFRHDVISMNAVCRTFNFCEVHVYRGALEGEL